MRMLLLSLALAGCVAGATGWEGREQAALDRELAGRVAGESESCISWRSTQSLHATGTGLFVYRDGGTIWVNRPIHECGSSFRPTHTLIVEMRGGSRYCRGDLIRAVEPGSSIPGPLCALGDFTPYRRAN
jgi:hypothetical protein